MIYQEHNSGTFSVRDKDVLELGSGTGAVGILAAKLGCRSVTLTDIKSILPVLENNVALNLPHSRGSVAPVGDIKVRELFW